MPSQTAQTCLRCGDPAQPGPAPITIRGEAVHYCQRCEEMMVRTLTARSKREQPA